MEKKLFKKSFHLRSFKSIPYDDLWDTKGVFTTIRVKGKKPKFIFLNEHLKNLNKSLKMLNIQFSMNLKNFKFIVLRSFKRNYNYNHLLRIAVNNNTISTDLRKRLKPRKFYTAFLVEYKRKQPLIKNLYYKKLIHLSKSINTQSTEMILVNKNNILEGITTNIICVKNKKLYIPKNNYYSGITLNFFKKFTKRKIYKINIKQDKLGSFDEILLVGSGKGIVAVKNIPQIKWINKSQVIYNELQELYNMFTERYDFET